MPAGRATGAQQAVLSCGCFSAAVVLGIALAIVVGIPALVIKVIF
jgi:hypothetical protein